MPLGAVLTGLVKGLWGRNAENLINLKRLISDVPVEGEGVKGPLGAGSGAFGGVHPAGRREEGGKVHPAAAGRGLLASDQRERRPSERTGLPQVGAACWGRSQG